MRSVHRDFVAALLERNNAVGDGAITLNASPAKAGVHPSAAGAADRWVPAFAGKAVWAWFHPLRVGGAGGELSGGLREQPTRLEISQNRKASRCGSEVFQGVSAHDVSRRK